MQNFKNNRISYYDFGGAGTILHFAHANAYPPGCYKQLITPFLNHFKVIGMNQRPLWENSIPEKIKNWSQLADDLILFFEQQGFRNIIGMGHSLGGVVTIIAAIKRPELFSRIILIDPVIIPNKFLWLTNCLPIFIRKKVIPPAKISSKRRDIWASGKAVFESFRKKNVFKRFSDAVLWDFVQAGIKPFGTNQVTLTYPKDWETQIYATAPSILNDLKKLNTPIIALKGEYSNVITSAVWKEWTDAQPNNDFLEYPNSGHLVPMEYPKEIAEWILGLLIGSTRK